MAGLMDILGRHSGLWTNFRIYIPESRQYWLPDCPRGAQVCGGPRGPGVPGWTRYPGPGTGWALAIPISWAIPGSWVVPGIAPSQYPVYYPPGTHPVPAQHRAHPSRHGAYVVGTCTYDRFQEAQGDPRGRITQWSPGTLTQPAPLALVPFGCCALLAARRPYAPSLLISQLYLSYISV